MRRAFVVLAVLVLGVACDPVPTVPVSQVSAGSGGDAVAVTGVLAQTPGRGWRWRTEDTGVVIDQGAAYFSSSALAEADAVRALGSGWPGTPTEDFDTVSDAEEDGWHYVGSGGSEPAFATYDDDANPATDEVPAWANAGTPWPAMAFRLREAGIVDIVGVVEVVGTTTTIFTLPADYRPNEQAFVPFVRSRSAVNSGQLLAISSAGTVNALDSAAGDAVYISGSFFLNTAAP